MLILIAESKSMNHVLQDVSASQFISHTPMWQARADMIMSELAGLSVAEIGSRLGIGPKSAKAMADDVYDFTNRATGIKAVDGFTGVVFKSFDPHSLDQSARLLMNQRVRIISSLYGWLRPDDIIKPYRLDFTAKAAPGGVAMSRFWVKDVTVSLVKDLQATGVTEVVNLLPMDASKCIDWKLVKNFADVLVPNFKVQRGEHLVTPNSTLLKTLRGHLLRHIICDDLRDGNALRRLTTSDLVYVGDDPYPGHLQFVTA